MQLSLSFVSWMGLWICFQSHHHGLWTNFLYRTTHNFQSFAHFTHRQMSCRSCRLSFAKCNWNFYSNQLCRMPCSRYAVLPHICHIEWCLSARITHHFQLMLSYYHSDPVSRQISLIRSQWTEPCSFYWITFRRMMILSYHNDQNQVCHYYLNRLRHFLFSCQLFAFPVSCLLIVLRFNWYWERLIV